MKFNLLYKATLYLLNFIYTFLSKQITKYHFLGNNIKFYCCPIKIYLKHKK